MTDNLTVLIPTGAPETEAIPTTPRPKSLKGLRVALLDNGKEFSDVVLDALAETLRRDYGVTNIKFWRKGFPAKGAPFIEEMAAETDVAVSGVGHCGSSSPWSVIDAVNLEKAGVPTVALISRSFCPLGQIVGRGVGHTGLPIVMLPHPIGEADESRIAQKGIDAAAEVVRLLTTQAETVNKEYAAKKFPLPEHAVARV
ncbi:MAG TPA: hypothetical protein VL574_03140 [Stellaceae bacterium]|jgi:hypothetical protein|nr:hypothetical protein [Stellaceae bacterium]